MAKSKTKSKVMPSKNEVEPKYPRHIAAVEALEATPEGKALLEFARKQRQPKGRS